MNLSRLALTLLLPGCLCAADVSFPVASFLPTGATAIKVDGKAQGEAATEVILTGGTINVVTYSVDGKEASSRYFVIEEKGQRPWSDKTGVGSAVIRKDFRMAVEKAKLDAFQSLAAQQAPSPATSSTSAAERTNGVNQVVTGAYMTDLIIGLEKSGSGTVQTLWVRVAATAP